MVLEDVIGMWFMEPTEIDLAKFTDPVAREFASLRIPWMFCLKAEGDEIQGTNDFNFTYFGIVEDFKTGEESFLFRVLMTPDIQGQTRQ
jgi:hypothetical protein